MVILAGAGRTRNGYCVRETGMAILTFRGASLKRRGVSNGVAWTVAGRYRDALEGLTMKRSIMLNLTGPATSPIWVELMIVGERRTFPGKSHMHAW